MKKRGIALLLITAMLASLAACGKNTDIKKEDDQNGASPVATVDDDGKVNGLMYKEGLPIVDEGAYSFSMFVDDSSETGEFYMLNEFKKQTNVDVELRHLPYETAKERLNLDINSGDYADVIAGWTLNDSMILTYGVQQGLFIPLEELIEEYCPNISAILDVPGVREIMTAPDGHIYTIPYATGDTLVGYSPYINGRWLENVGMDMPTTTEEFEAVLEAFKEKDANGNGNANDEIPFSTDPNNKRLEAMTGYFGLPMDKVGMGIKNDEVVYGGISSEYRQFLSWFNKLYSQGLIDAEIFTQDSATWSGKGNKDMYGVSIAYGSSEFSGIEQAKEKSEFDSLPVLNTEDSGLWLRDTSGFSVYRTQVAITDKAQNPEIILRWFDNAFELENGIGCAIGPVGLAVEKDGEGYRALDKTTLSDELQEQIAWNNLWPQSVSKYLPRGFKVQEDNPNYDEKKAMELAYEPHLTNDIIPSFWVSLDKIDRYADISTAITEYFEQQQALFITGELNVNSDKDWNSYIDGLRGLGLEDWLEIRGVDKIAE